MQNAIKLAIGATLISVAAHAQAVQRPAEGDFMSSMHNMHQSMMKANDQDADRAFALKMIEHHRGGISMSEVLMKHGDDAELKGMAQKTADMQRKEIAELQAWLDRHGGRESRR